MKGSEKNEVGDMLPDQMTKQKLKREFKQGENRWKS
jgi:hypothetical protein